MDVSSGKERLRTQGFSSGQGRVVVVMLPELLSSRPVKMIFVEGFLPDYLDFPFL